LKRPILSILDFPSGLGMETRDGLVVSRLVRLDQGGVKGAALLAI
jgi:hypothetical protein